MQQDQSRTETSQAMANHSHSKVSGEMANRQEMDNDGTALSQLCQEWNDNKEIAKLDVIPGVTRQMNKAQSNHNSLGKPLCHSSDRVTLTANKCRETISGPTDECAETVWTACMAFQ